MTKKLLPIWMRDLDILDQTTPGPKAEVKKREYKKRENERRDTAIDFIQAHYEYLTVRDIAEELDETIAYIWQLCGSIGVHPISVKDQAFAYIKDHYQKLPRKSIAKRLEMCEETVRHYYCELGILEPKFEEKVAAPTPREILAGFQITDKHHWNDFLSAQK